MLRILLSILTGWILGKERKRHEKSGGSRTMAIVCLSACLVAILSQKLSTVYHFDFFRLMAYTIAGISFIGNGVITQYKQNVEGLTTASTLLINVILGFLIGLEFYFYGIVGTVIMYVLLESKYWKSKE